jgi:hypothetical protein
MEQHDPLMREVIRDVIREVVKDMERHDPLLDAALGELA